MGRKKINIKPIEHASTRRSTFEKRRIGLLKKAIELSILCKSTLSLTIYTEEGEVYVYSSEPYENIVSKFQNYRGSYRLLTNDHLPDLIPGKSESNSVGFEIIKQPNVNTMLQSTKHNIHNLQSRQIINNQQPLMVMPLIQTNVPRTNSSSTSTIVDPSFRISSNSNSNSRDLTPPSPSMNPYKKRRRSSVSSVSSTLSLATMRAINQLDVTDVYHGNESNKGRKRKWQEMTGSTEDEQEEEEEEEGVVPEFDLPSIFKEGSVEFDHDLSVNMQNNAFLQ